MFFQEDFILKELSYWNIPGVSVGICNDHEILSAEGYGYRDLDTKAPMTGDTLGGIASCSKSFTSAVIASLAEEKLLDPDRPVREWIPGFALMDPIADSQCTVMDMLYHMSGLAPHDAIWPDPALSPQQLIERLRYLEPNRPFRSKAQYNNTIYAALGAIAGIAAGTSWETLVKERIFAPLEMKRSTLTVREMRDDTDWAVGYFGKERCSALSAMDPWEMDIAGPAAGVNSSAREMMHWIMLHLGRGSFRGKTLFRPETMDEMHRAAVDISAFPWKFPEVPGIGWYGMAWKTTFYRDMKIIYHCGEVEGYCSIELFLPDHNLGMFLLCNRHKPQTPFLMELVYTAIDQYFGFPYVDWAERLHPYETVFSGSCDDWLFDFMPGEPVTGTVPSREIEAFEGNYRHPAYGTLRIASGKAVLPPEIAAPAAEDRQDCPDPQAALPLPADDAESRTESVSLSLEYKKWILPLKHYHYDTFRVENLKEDTLYYTLPLTFRSDPLTGEITGFTLPLEPTVSPVFFARQCLCRHAVEADLPAVCGIYDEIHTLEETGKVQIGWERNVYPVPSTARASLGRGDLFVMECSGEVVATAIINRCQVPAYKDACWSYACGETEAMVLHTLIVSPRHFGKGYGTAFIKFYEDYAIARKCHVLRMDTNEKNKSARILYQKLGYREADIVPTTFNGIAGVRLVCLEKYL